MLVFTKMSCHRIIGIKKLLDGWVMGMPEDGITHFYR